MFVCESETNAGLPGATVTLTLSSNGQQLSGVTDDNGTAIFMVKMS